MMDPNTPGNVRTRYIGQWLFYGGWFALFLGIALWLADAYGFIAWDETYANVATYTSYLLVVIGALAAMVGYLFSRR